MVDSVSSSTSLTSTSTTSSTASSSLSSNYDMFLQLLCTQLETQNPLDPTDPSEFTSQLATYSQLEQQVATNDKLDSVLSQFGTVSFSSGVGYLGRTVEADSDTLSVSSDGSVDASWKYSLDSTASKVTLTVTDADGNTVWSGSGETAAGDHAFTWDGTASNGKAVAAGDYTLKVAATNSSGSTVASSIAISGNVTAVDSSDGTTVLELGDTQVELGSITRLAA